MEALDHAAQLVNGLEAAKAQIEAAQCDAGEIPRLREDLATAKAALEATEADKADLEKRLASAIADLEAATALCDTAASAR